MKRFFNKHISLILCLVLVAAVVPFVGCTKTDNKSASSQVVSTTGGQKSEGGEVGVGKTSFNFKVTSKDGKVTDFKVNTDKTNLGEALTDVGLIEGENSQYGLYVKKVNGEEHDFNVDGTFWSLYENGEMAMTGVDGIVITAGATYEFKAE